MPNNDYILRSDALRCKCTFEQSNGVEIEPIDAVPFSYLQNIPAADVEPVRHGYNVKWDYPTLFECSLCGWECFDTVPGDTDTYQYCPHCGAKMDAEPPKEESEHMEPPEYHEYCFGCGFPPSVIPPKEEQK